MSDEARLGTFDPGALTLARGQAHQAVQLIAAAGETYLAHTPDTSHTNMEWLGAHGALAGGLVRGARPFRLALRIADLHLLILDAAGAVHQAQALAGATAEQSEQLASDWVRAFTDGALDRTLTHPGYDLPVHPVADGHAFEADGKALSDLARWFEHANHSLQKIADDHPDEATPARCWPHHFDHALLLEIQRGPDGTATRTVGIGLSPGDETYGEPYWYVNHWPGAAAPELAEQAGGGEWHTEGWTGCILRASVIAADATIEDQGKRVSAFLDRAIELNRGMAGA
ncbi:MAG: hypothetical protein JRG95_07385 [Deltaproteobacteria bacterium]|nr:hypothetical protein [Deltaproteobacteria bacterium]